MNGTPQPSSPAPQPWSPGFSASAKQPAERQPSSLISQLAALAGCAYMGLVGFTTSLKFGGSPLPPPAPGAAPGQVIYVLWHCQQSFLIYAHRGRGIAALASKSRDGEYVAEFLRGLGYYLVRGSTNKGAMRSLIQLIQCARDGYTLALTPDGPKGPARKVQKGALYLARKTGLPIIAIAGSLSSKLTARSWDRFQIPLPFGRAAIAYSAPFYVAKDDDLDSRAEALEKVLNETGLRADELLGL